MAKYDEKVVGALNEVLRMELTVINQFFLHAQMLEQWGYTKIAKEERDESIEEMKHAETIIKRILYIGACPELSDLNSLRIGKDVQKIREYDLEAENDAISIYRKSLAILENTDDCGTRNMLEELLVEEEQHCDHLTMQVKMINDMGLQNYLQTCV